MYAGKYLIRAFFTCMDKKHIIVLLIMQKNLAVLKNLEVYNDLLHLEY